MLWHVHVHVCRAIRRQLKSRVTVNLIEVQQSRLRLNYMYVTCMSCPSVRRSVRPAKYKRKMRSEVISKV
jgi:hypothetical protein